MSDGVLEVSDWLPDDGVRDGDRLLGLRLEGVAVLDDTDSILDERLADCGDGGDRDPDASSTDASDAIASATDDAE